MCDETTTFTSEDQRYEREQASRYLKRVRDAKRHIAALTAEVEEVRSLASGLKGIDYSRDVVQVSPTDDKMPDAVSRLIDLIEQRVELIRDYASMMEDCGAALANLNGTYADILRYRYMCDHPWERIAVETHYSEAYLYELHGAALSAFYPFMPERERDPLPSAI